MTSRLVSTSTRDWRYIFQSYVNIWPSYGRSKVKFRRLVRENLSFSPFRADISESHDVSDMWLSRAYSLDSYLRMACIWGICAVVIAACRLGSLKVTFAARHRRRLVGRCGLVEFAVACNVMNMKLRCLKWTWYLPFMWHQMSVFSHIICPNVSISLQPGQKITQCELILRRKVHTFHWLVAEASSWFNILIHPRLIRM